MPENFSIIRNIDIEVLERKLDAWNNTHDYFPIILISVDTFKDLPPFISDNTVICSAKYICKYHGCKVFIDPEKTYGEVELR